MYGKVFTSLYDSTLATNGPWQAMALWPHLIALADNRGHVDMTAEIISRRTTLPLDEVVRPALLALSAPDPDSRSTECEGRRIVLIDANRAWGWRLVNYDAYCKIRNEDERRAYQAKWIKDKRQGLAENVDSCRQVSTVSTHVDVDVDVKPKPVARSAVANRAPPDLRESVDDDFEAFWSTYPGRRKHAKAQCKAKWQRLPAKTKVDAFKALLVLKTSPDWTKDGGEYVPAVLTFLNQKRWLGDEKAATRKLPPGAKGWTPSGEPWY